MLLAGVVDSGAGAPGTLEEVGTGLTPSGVLELSGVGTSGMLDEVGAADEVGTGTTPSGVLELSGLGATGTLELGAAEGV